jgi:hypothetical protein
LNERGIRLNRHGIRLNRHGVLFTHNRNNIIPLHFKFIRI